MRIAIVTHNARAIGGVESYLDTAIPMLEEAGYEIALLCEHDAPGNARAISRSPDAPSWCAAEIGARHALESLRRWRPAALYTHGLSDPALEERVLACAPAIAFAHDYRGVCISGAKAFGFPASMPCTRSFGAGCLVSFYPRRCGGLNPRSMLNDFRCAARRLALLRNCRAVLTASDYVRAEYVRNGLAPESVHCIGLPIVERGGALRAAPDALRDASAASPLRLLFAGRMESLKGGRVLLDALPLVSSALSRPLVLTFAGDGGSRFEWARHADAISRSVAAVRVEFTGWVDSSALASLFDSSDLLVVPSLWPEPFGLVGPEAGIRGLPAAAFAVGGISEWLTDGVNGGLARGLPLTPAGLADAIVRCVRDPAEHARLRRGAVDLARRFSPERHLAALANVIEEISAQPAAINTVSADRVTTTTASARSS